MIENELLLELLWEFEQREADYTIENGWLTTYLGNERIRFRIDDEDQTDWLLDMIWNW